ncbi:TonB-dependent receptor [Lutibacter sp. HS1-25]|uniref:carboxypeptidase-like regulatory domain-containing protein n=1 Tax=Lutibacter sp. HS1-25 TaxID=2485000 RepID=UPI001013A1DB|nr:carboxypeptidase regulatory-like domain-containing protein [Lutibacter sp. HS1-25]RXP64533.1 TonB-dependent receptor [Lutibacter sp. HS1-25]
MKKVLFIAIFYLSFFQITLAQSTLQGKIVDAYTENPIANVSVKINGTNLEIKTNSEGIFEFQNLTTGSYLLIATIKNYQPKNIPFAIFENQNTDLGIVYLEATIPEFEDKSIILLTDDDLSDDNDQNSTYVSGVFQSSKDIYLKAAAYNFSQAWFKVRGYDSSQGTISINGVEMNKLYDGRPQWSNWGGLNDAFRNQQFTTGIAPASYTFGGVLGTTNFSVRASDHQPGAKASLASTNKSYNGRMMMTYATGFTKNNWAFVGSGSYRASQNGYNDGTTYNAWSGYFSAEKKLNQKHSFNFTALTAYNKRGKSSANTQEVYDLKGYKYNSYWGEQKGDNRNARMKEIMEPMVLLSHYYNNNKTSIITTLAYQFGHIGNSRLGYFNAPNPDPTYWKYLPSYYLRFKDNLDYSNAYLSEQNFKNNGQINWSNLYQVNADKGNALYYLYEDRVEDSQLSFNAILNTNLNNNFNLNAGIYYQNLNSKNYANMLDLLGGNGFLDLDQYALGDAKQNDLNNPNKMVNVGQDFQYNYTIKASVFEAFAQLQHVGKKVDYFASFNINNTSYQREGLYKNGTYPTNSFGKSEQKYFLNISAKGGLTYKFSGRHLASLNAGYFSNPPNIRNTFSNSRVNSNYTPNLTSEKIITGDLTYMYRAPKFQGRITGYYTKFSNAIETSFLFAEGLQGDEADFVNEIVTGIEKLNRGVELSAMYQINSLISILAAGSFGQFTYNNNPNLYLASDNFVDSNADFGTSYLKNYRVSGTPQQGYSLGFEYRDPKFWWFQINGNLLTNNYLDISPLLRTNNFYLDADGIPFVDDETGVEITQNQVDNLLHQEKFDAVFLLNIVGGKSWLKQHKYFGFFIGINNVLGEIYKTGGFEQPRNANYSELKQDKQLNTPLFGPKYWYGNGASYYINFYVRI